MGLGAWYSLECSTSKINLGDGSDSDRRVIFKNRLGETGVDVARFRSGFLLSLNLLTPLLAISRTNYFAITFNIAFTFRVIMLKLLHPNTASKYHQQVRSPHEILIGTSLKYTKPCLFLKQSVSGSFHCCQRSGLPMIYLSLFFKSKLCIGHENCLRQFCCIRSNNLPQHINLALLYRRSLP